jgi:hypothetical protein
LVIWPEAFTRNRPPEVLVLVLEELLDEELLELLLDEELLLEVDVEVEELELEELLLEEELLLVVELELPLIDPAEAVSVTRSIREPSSRRTIRSVCEPAARLLKVARLSVA